MDTGLSIKPAASVAQTGGGRADPAARATAPTELAPAKTVTAASNTTPVQTSDPHTRDILLDPHSREVIHRAVDLAAGRLVSHVPDEARLRLRAYTRAARDKKKSGKRAFDETA